MNPARFASSRAALLGLLLLATLAFPAGAMASHSDNRVNFQPLTLGDPLEGQSNNVATTEAGEELTCGSIPFGRTVWYRFTLPAPGKVTISVLTQPSQNPDTPTANFDSVAVLYPSSGPQIACNDDGVAGQIGSSKIVQDNMAAGTYFVQVGGVDYEMGGPDYGPFSIEARFEEDLDIDNDGFNRAPGPDCNDTNAGINPNATDVPYNGVDEDCRGGDDLDADNDGFNRGPDCNDANAAMSPGRREIKGNFVDENCDGKSPAARLSPTPGILFFRQAFPAKRGTLVRELTLFRLRRGYRITVKCKGKGCPRRTQRRTIRKGRKASFRVYANRLLKKGAVVTIFVTRPGTNRLGEFFRYRMASNAVPLPTEGCLAPGKLKKRSCRT